MRGTLGPHAAKGDGYFNISENSSECTTRGGPEV